MELWRKTTFNEYGFCLCCKNEVVPGEDGYESIKGIRKPENNKVYRSKLCMECQKEFISNGTNNGLCNISRFKI